MRIATLNVQNMRLLTVDGHRQLHGAWDTDVPEDQDLDPIDRSLTAALLAELDADVVALQEVFDRQTLDYFHDEFLLKTGCAPYDHRICIPGNDGRGLDVAILSRRPFTAVRSHAATTLDDLGIAATDGIDPSLPIFRRDCLMAEIGRVTLVVCHFKSPYPDVARAWNIRRMEALATRHLVERRFGEPDAGLWLILGDLNEPTSEMPMDQRAIAPIENGFSVDLMSRIPSDERWTYFDPFSGQYHCPDAMLASDALAKLFPLAVPRIIRRGLGTEAARFAGDRFRRVGDHRPHASDHAAVMIDLAGL